jgi:probable phosphoglycerate mutase
MNNNPDPDPRHPTDNDPDRRPNATDPDRPSPPNNPDRQILLLRHAETGDNRDPVRVQGRRDVPLSPAGRRQAQALAASIASTNGGFAALYCSDLERSRETAQIIGAALDLRPVEDSRFSESRRGQWEGRTWEEIERADPDGYSAWRRAGPGFRFPGGESLAEHSDRVQAGLADIATSDRLPALVVCHGGTIRVALCRARGLGLDAFHEWDVPNGALVAVPADRL